MSKKVNVDLNLTPFIGLFALLVVNLLLTAVWNHVAALSTNTASTSASSDPNPPPEEPDKKKVSLKVTIMRDKVEMSEDEKIDEVPHLVGGKINNLIFIEKLKVWKQKYPKRNDVILNTENGVTYQMLITVFDTLVGNEWPDVGVSTQ